MLRIRVMHVDACTIMQALHVHVHVHVHLHGVHVMCTHMTCGGNERTLVCFAWAIVLGTPGAMLSRQTGSNT